MSNDHLVVIPTYNEMKSLPEVLGRLHESCPEFDVLIVDDSSPDGTGQWVDEFSKANPWLSAHHRPSKSGLATAYVEGFGLGLERGYRVIAQMDADGSHRPEELGRLANRLDAPDQPAGVIGARWLPGGEVSKWTPSRRFLSVGGNLYIRAALGLGKLHDVTAGFRAYRASALAELGVLSAVTSTGFTFQAEMTYLLVSNGYKLAETPIRFDDRLAGESKMSANIAVEQLIQITRWGLARIPAAFQPRR